MKEKTFKTFEEQKNILESRNLTFSRPIADMRVLSKTNYYLLTGYKSLLLKSRNPEIYKDGAMFEELYNLYLFDKELKMIFLDILLEIEQSIKTVIAYEISSKYGTKQSDYLNKENFDKSSPYLDSNIDKIKKQLRDFGKNNKAIKHYKDKYKNIPLWVAVKVLTFGVIHNLYSVMKPSDRDYIAKKVFVIDFDKKRSKNLNNFLQMLVDARNMCAHDEIFMNFMHGSIKIPNTKYHECFNLYKKGDEYIEGRKDLFALLIAIKHFVSKTRYKQFVNKIDRLIFKHMKKVNSYTKEDLLKYMNLPDDFSMIKDL